MNDNKKIALFDEIIGYLYEVINNNEEFKHTMLALGLDENYINDWIN